MTACAHRVTALPHRATALPDARAPRGQEGVCCDCGTQLAGRSLDAAWERALTGQIDEPELRALQLDEVPWDAHSRHGFLARWVLHDDQRLQRDVDVNLARIAELVAVVKALERMAPPPLEGAECDALPGALAPMRLTYLAVLGVLGVALVNAIRVRGGDYEGVVQPHRARATPYAGYRHALAAAFTDETALGGLGAGGLGSPQPSGNAPDHGLPSGMLFNTISVAPSASSSGRARGEDRLLARLAVVRALNTAQLGQRHQRAKDGTLHEVHPGRGGLTRVHVELLRLVDVGDERAVARRDPKNDTLLPALDPLRLKDALGKVRARAAEFPSAPRTEHEASLMVRAARAAVVDQFLVFELIPAPEARPRPRPAPPPPVDPFAVPR